MVLPGRNPYPCMMSSARSCFISRAWGWGCFHALPYCTSTEFRILCPRRAFGTCVCSFPAICWSVVIGGLHCFMSATLTAVLLRSDWWWWWGCHVPLGLYRLWIAFEFVLWDLWCWPSSWFFPRTRKPHVSHLPDLVFLSIESAPSWLKPSRPSFLERTIGTGREPSSDNRTRYAQHRRNKAKHWRMMQSVPRWN